MRERGESLNEVSIHELIAWDLDEYPYRSSGMKLSAEEFAEKAARAASIVSERRSYTQCNAVLDSETREIRELLSSYMTRSDLQREYEGLVWSLRVVDLRCVLAFQRRLVFDSEAPRPLVPPQSDWVQLVSLAFGSTRNTEYSVRLNHQNEEWQEIHLESRNPDLQLRLSTDSTYSRIAPLSLYGGSPFFEVAEFHGRWFLRDGYHRAYDLLQAGVYAMPAVVIHARTIEEVGAIRPWFFSEEILFSTHPPYLMDFLEEDLVVRYRRQRLIKRIRIRIEESLCETETQGDTL